MTGNVFHAHAEISTDITDKQIQPVVVNDK